MRNKIDRINDALKIAEDYALVDGAHHKMWVIDQMLKSLLDDKYQAWLENRFEDGEWDVGITP